MDSHGVNDGCDGSQSSAIALRAALPAFSNHSFGWSFARGVTTRSPIAVSFTGGFRGGISLTGVTCLTVLVALALGGCVTTAEQIDQTFRGYGFRPGTEAFAQRRMKRVLRPWIALRFKRTSVVVWGARGY